MMDAHEQPITAVIATKGRVEELRVVLQSLLDQTSPVSQINIVDQNEDDVLRPVIESFPDLPIDWMRRPDLQGLNNSRNAGWQSVSSGLVFFPDDDCWYPVDFLAKVRALFAEHRPDMLSGRAADENLRSINGRFLDRAVWVDESTVWFAGIEWVFFARIDVLQQIDGFDGVLGVGALTPWGAGEMQDLLLRAMQTGYRQYYTPDLYAHHAEFDVRALGSQAVIKGSSYAHGLGYVLAKHGYGYLSAIKWSARPLAKALFSLAVGNLALFRYSLAMARGRMNGYLRARKIFKAEARR